MFRYSSNKNINHKRETYEEALQKIKNTRNYYASNCIREKINEERITLTKEEIEEQVQKTIQKNTNHRIIDFMVCILWLFIVTIAVPDAVYLIGKNTVLSTRSISSVWYIMTVLFFAFAAMLCDLTRRRCIAGGFGRTKRNNHY